MPTIRIKGMSCQHCVDSVSKALSALGTVSDVVVNLESGEVHYQETSPTADEVIKNAITGIGFEIIR